MKKILLISLFLILLITSGYVLTRRNEVVKDKTDTTNRSEIFSTNSKDTSPTKESPSQPYNKITVKDYSTLCKDDIVCKKYYAIWKSEQMFRSKYDEAYFNKHIVPESVEILKWNEGESFAIIYNITIDWATVKTSDGFIVKTNKGDKSYPAVKISRGEYLTEQEVKLAIDANAYNGSFTLFKPVERLLYKNQKDARKVISDRGLSQKFEVKEFNFIKGDISMKAYDSTDCSNNNLKRITLDLITGEINTTIDACLYT